MFLILQDYAGQIQLDNLSQIVNSDQTQRIKMELVAQAEIISYLAQRYDTADVFREISEFSYSATYDGGDLIYLDGTAYAALTVYTSGNLVLYQGRVYMKNAITSLYVAGTLPTNATYFNDLGLQYSLFYITYPEARYDNNISYSSGDKVFWKNKTYTCVNDITGVTPDTSFYWGTGTAYSVTATIPTDTTKWTSGDIRNQQIVLYMVNIALYYLHMRISPKNIPQLRIDAYDMAIAWLKKCGRGEVTAALPLIIPNQGSRIRFGGVTKNVNHY